MSELRKERTVNPQRVLRQSAACAMLSSSNPPLSPSFVGSVEELVALPFSFAICPAIWQRKQWAEYFCSTDPTKEGESGGFEEDSIAHAADCLRTRGGVTVLSFFSSLMKCKLPSRQ